MPDADGHVKGIALSVDAEKWERIFGNEGAFVRAFREEVAALQRDNEREHERWLEMNGLHA